VARRERVSIQHKGRHEATFEAVISEENAECLQQIAQAWLESERWDPDLWGEFTIREGRREVRAA
jgi:hypothetical protein